MSSRTRSIVVSLAGITLFASGVQAEATKLETWSVFRDADGSTRIETSSPLLDTGVIRGERTSATAERIRPTLVLDLAPSHQQWLASAALQHGWYGSVLSFRDFAPLTVGNTPVDAEDADESPFGDSADEKRDLSDEAMAYGDPEAAFGALALAPEDLGGFSTEVEQSQADALLSGESDGSGGGGDDGAQGGGAVPAPGSFLALLLLSRRRRSRGDG